MKNAFIIILIIAIIGGTGYGIYYQIDSWNKRENKVVSPPISQIEDINIDSDLVKKTMENFNIDENKNVTNDNNYIGYLYSNKINDEYKIYIAISNLIKNKIDEKMITISNIEVKEKIKEIFGNTSYKDTSLTKESCNLPKFNYNETTKNYTSSEIICDNKKISQLNSKITSAKRNNNKLEIIKTIYYQETINNKTNIYNNINKQKLLKEQIDEKIDIYKEYETNLEKYRYIFIKGNDGNYYFEKIEKI